MATPWTANPVINAVNNAKQIVGYGTKRTLLAYLADSVASLQVQVTGGSGGTPPGATSAFSTPKTADAVNGAAGDPAGDYIPDLTAGFIVPFTSSDPLDSITLPADEDGKIIRWDATIATPALSAAAVATTDLVFRIFNANLATGPGGGNNINIFFDTGNGGAVGIAVGTEEVYFPLSAAVDNTGASATPVTPATSANALTLATSVAPGQMITCRFAATGGATGAWYFY